MNNEIKTPRAYLYSDTEPTAEQQQRLEAFLLRTYGEDIPLRWAQTPGIKDGFRLEVGSDVYDWTLEGRLRQFQERINRMGGRIETESSPGQGTRTTVEIGR